MNCSHIFSHLPGCIQGKRNLYSGTVSKKDKRIFRAIYPKRHFAGRELIDLRREFRENLAKITRVKCASKVYLDLIEHEYVYEVTIMEKDTDKFLNDMIEGKL